MIITNTPQFHDIYFFGNKSKIVSQSIIDGLFLRYFVSFSKKDLLKKLIPPIVIIYFYYVNYYFTKNDLRVQLTINLTSGN